MHVTFISQCEKKSIRKTRSILDRYAVRTGTRTWTTPITKEALTEVNRALRTKATRHTAIACFVNKGNRAMRLLWIVGNKNAFGINGEVPIATRGGTMKQDKKWVSEAIMLAETAGLAHDLGKTSLDFSSKISPSCKDKNRSDPIRHELISAFLVKNMMDENSWMNAWPVMDFSPGSQLTKTFSPRGPKKEAVLFSEIDTPKNSLLFLVATHHHLFEKGTAKRHVRPLGEAKYAQAKMDQDRDDDPIRKIAEISLSNFKTYFEKNTASRRKLAGLTLYARAALILADQKGSSDISHPVGMGDDHQFYANTTKNNDGSIVYNQTLKQHLTKIASEARKITSGMSRSPITPLSDETKKRILASAGKQFNWQNIAAKSLTPNRPTLLLNIAATGAGKTIMNLRASAVLSGNTPLAITTTLGLRALTLQTGDSYKQDLNIKDNEVATIIGCMATRRLHEYETDDEKSVPVSETELEEDLMIDVAGGDSREIPSYLKGFQKAEHCKSLLTSPILVSTIDYVISAGDLTKKSAHGLAILRLMHSDLIIDEVDGFEPKSLAAILRIVKVSAMFGRNVIASSGTLPIVIAEYLLKAYESGHQIYTEMNEIAESFDAIVIDDSVEPLVMNTPKAEAFGVAYKNHLELLQAALLQKTITKKAILIDTNKSESSIDEAIARSSDLFHRDHAWVSSSGKRVSIGLVRIANIRNAIRVATTMSQLEGTHVVCYHARHFMMQRFYIEQKLDKLLKRKKDTGESGNQWMKAFESDEDIARILSTSTGDIKIIVVATPVEEVGRDHDFDWAIIEPTSTQSIVQTAGRVNRHRKFKASNPNVGILRFNYRSCNGKSEAFCRPGYEINGSHQYADMDSKSGIEKHDVAHLIDFKRISDSLDSSLRFDEAAHPFSKLDSKSIKETLKQHADFFINFDERWMSSDAYRDAALRDNSNMVEFYIEKNQGSGVTFFEKQINEYGKINNIQRNNIWNWPANNTDKMLFGLSVEKMIEMCKKADLDEKMGLAIKCYELAENQKHDMTNFGCVK